MKVSKAFACLPIFIFLTATGLATPTAHLANGPIDATVSLEYPGFSSLSVDSVSREHFSPVLFNRPTKPPEPVVAVQHGFRIEYRSPAAPASARPAWSIEIDSRKINLQSRWSAAHPPGPLRLDIDNRSCHVTLLGVLNEDGSVRLPAIMHIPGQGSFRVSATPETDAALGYAAEKQHVNITFPSASAANPEVRYNLELIAIAPNVAGIKNDSRFDAFRRDWLNIFQISPSRRTLANHAASDTCAFCYYAYADIAAKTPPLARGLTALDMVRQTLDQILGGSKAYGMPGYPGYPPEFPENSADTLPSLLIAADDYVQGSKDTRWLAANYPKLKSWADQMLATDRSGDGLIDYVLSGNSGSWPEKIKYRPANWWDTIGFGYEDAYANALAYRALRDMETLAAESEHSDDQSRFRQAADKLQAAYFKTFYNPSTGVLAGWRSADGELHDYYFPWVSGIAIHYGLVPADTANGIMDRLLKKMKEVGYTRFDLGLPGNLVPVARKDYVDHHRRFGGGVKADNSDGFQIYENGGATACYAYFTLAALYDLNRIQDGDRILFPILDSIGKGGFEGQGANGYTRDWKAWDGTCWGYEGFLVDNYYVLLAVLDREAALKRVK